MFKLIIAYLGLTLLIGIGGSIYDLNRQMALSGKHAYQFDQMSYPKFTRAMTDVKPRRLGPR